MRRFPYNKNKKTMRTFNFNEYELAIINAIRKGRESNEDTELLMYVLKKTILERLKKVLSEDCVELTHSTAMIVAKEMIEK